jgi:prepilin-type N-terminal cleavage/methylation domain-containing protein/prepilin-type processing-associated H-X9-DG protein
MTDSARAMKKYDPQHSWHSGFTLIELLVTMTIISILLCLMLPAVQQARESARCLQCKGNLRQLSIAAHSYHDSYETFPMGAYFGAAKPISSNSGPFTFSLLPYIEQQAVLNSINFNFSPDVSINQTIHGIGIGGLWCPSDPIISQEVRLTRVLFDDPTKFVANRYCSYGANCGTFFLVPRLDDPTRTQQIASLNGVIFENSRVRIADVKDGTSTTILFAERWQGIGPASLLNRWHWWTSSIGTQVGFMWPLNPQRAVKNATVPTIMDGGSVYVVSASSCHPAGANLSFVDGSVRFVKDTIDSWPINKSTFLPDHVTFSPKTSTYNLGPGVRVGLFQSLSTRAGGELTSADSY